MTEEPDDQPARETDRTDDADRLNDLALRNDAVPAAAGASSLPPDADDSEGAQDRPDRGRGAHPDDAAPRP